MLTVTRVESMGHRGDCACRSLAFFLGVPYDEADELLRATTSYDPNAGVSVHEYTMLLLDLGAVFQRRRVRLTAPRATERLPRRAILLFHKHVAAYVGGTIYDTFPLTWHKGMKQTQGYFVMPKDML